jgi:hypothetical protein
MFIYTCALLTDLPPQAGAVREVVEAQETEASWFDRRSPGRSLDEGGACQALYQKGELREQEREGQGKREGGSSSPALEICTRVKE